MKKINSLIILANAFSASGRATRSSALKMSLENEIGASWHDMIERRNGFTKRCKKFIRYTI
jgi:hypothetical protein